MEDKFKPFLQVIPVLTDPISSSYSYDPSSGYEEGGGGTENDPVLGE